jgi:hypothetical protein
MQKESQQLDLRQRHKLFSCARRFLFPELCEEYLVSDANGVSGGQRCEWSGGFTAIKAKRTEGGGSQGTHIAGRRGEWFLSR